MAFSPAAIALVYLAFAASALAAPKWIKITSDDVVVYSEASEKEATQFAVGYAAFRHAFTEFFAPGRRFSPTQILLFRRMSALRAFDARTSDKDKDLLAFTTEVDGAPLLALSTEGGDTPLTIAYEFDTIQALRRCGYFLPIWMSQGAGEVFSSLRYRNGKCLLGAPGRFGDWQDARIRWEEFFRITPRSTEYNQPELDYHDQAWGVMHWILLSEGDGRARFRDLAQKLGEMPAVDAVAAVMKTAPAKFEAEILKHLRRSNFRKDIAFDEAAVRSRVKVEPAPDLELNLHLCSLYAAANRPLEAENHLRQAETLAPDSALVKEASARRALRNGYPERAIELYREAIAAGSRSPAAYRMSAANRMGNRNQPGTGGDEIEVTLGEIRQALTLNAGDPEAYELLGRALYLLPKLTREHVAELDGGPTEGPEGAAVRQYRALLYRRLNLKEEYVAELNRLLEVPGLPAGMRNFAEQSLAAEGATSDFGRIEQLVRDRQYTEARQIIAAAREKKLRPSLARQYDGVEAILEEKEAWENLVALVQAKRYAEFLEGAKVFRERFPESRMLGNLTRAEAAAKEKQGKSTL